MNIKKEAAEALSFVLLALKIEAQNGEGGALNPARMEALTSAITPLYAIAKNQLS